MKDVLLSRHGGVAKCRGNLPGTREVCIKDPEEVWDDEHGKAMPTPMASNLKILSDASSDSVDVTMYR